MTIQDCGWRWSSVLSSLLVPMGLAAGCNGGGDGGGSGQCPQLPGQWEVEGEGDTPCAVDTLCTVTQTGCSIHMTCDNGDSYTGSLANNTFAFSNSSMSCSGALESLDEADPEAEGTCTISGTECGFQSECQSGACYNIEPAGAGGTAGTNVTSTSGNPTCTQTGVTCADGVLTACEDGVAVTATCEDQCAADGFTPASECSATFAGRCACGGDVTNATCASGLDAFCACLDTSPACQDAAALETYARCHRDPNSETAAILTCFGTYLAGDQIACNDAILACGSSAPDGSCTADVDCAECERCELSTGNCLTRLTCN